MIPPTSEKKIPGSDIKSPPHNIGTMLPMVEPTNMPSQINFLVIQQERISRQLRQLRQLISRNWRHWRLLLLCSRCGLLCDDLCRDFVVGGLIHNFLLDELVLGPVRPAIDNLLSGYIAHTGERHQLLLARSIDVDEIRLLLG